VSTASVLRADVLGGRWVGHGAVDSLGIEVGSGQRLAQEIHRQVTVLVVDPLADRLIEACDRVVPLLAADQRQGAEGRNASRGRVGERVVDALVRQAKAEQPPVDLDVAHLLDLADPLGRLPRPRARRVEVETDVFGHGCLL
jgi:hypothetical protein